MLYTKPPKGRAEFNKFYNNPDGTATWEAANLVMMPLPYTMYYGKTAVKKIQVHVKVKESLTKVLKEILAQVRVQVKKEVGTTKTTAEYDALVIKRLKKLRLDIFGGTYNFRKIRGGKALSTHAAGAAIDIDPANNGLGDTTPAMPAWVVTIFESNGWVWGGRFPRKDGMHFQFARGV